MTSLNETSLAKHISFEEYLRWPDTEFCEWEDGIIIPFPQIDLTHDALSRFFRSAADVYLDLTTGGRVLSAPFVMRVSDAPNARQPDVMIVKQENLSRVKRTYLDGPADVVIEVISEESVDRDRGRKFIEYEAGKVKEYWIIDPLRQEMLFYTLNDEGLFQPIPLDASGVFRSIALPNFALDVRNFWKQPIPDTFDTVSLVQRMLAT